MQAKILKLLPNLQEQRGSGIVFITPGIALGRKVNGRIAIMLDAKIIEEGPSNHNVTAYYGFRLNINSKVLSIVQYRPPFRTKGKTFEKTFALVYYSSPSA